MPNFISEDHIERALAQKLQHLHGFDVLECHTEDPEDLDDGSGRTSKSDVILGGPCQGSSHPLEPGHPGQGDWGCTGKAARPASGAGGNFGLRSRR
jgi:type I restriction enzyme, R subunit